jgi:hypothetical protein
MAKLTSAQVRRFRDTLLDAFGTLDSFDEFMALRVERNREEIVTAEGGLGLGTIMFRVIQAAESEGWTEGLLRAAADARQNLAPLQEVVQALTVQVQAPVPPLPPPAGVNAAEVAEQLARLFQAGLTELGEHGLSRARLSLQDNIRHVRRMAVYKDAHDGLQEIEADYNTLYPDLYPDGKLATADQVRWSGISRRCRTMLNTIDALVEQARATFLSEQETYLIETLQQASADLGAAVDGEALDDLDGAMLDIYEIIRKHSPRLNTNIIAEVKELSLLELADALRIVYDKIAQEARAEAAARIDGFGEALDAFEGTADRLTILRDEHDRWQLIEDDLRREADQLPTRGMDPFRRRWQKTICVRLMQESTGRTESWAVRLRADVAKLEQALERADLNLVADALFNCRLTVTSRFRQVDDELKRVCDGLRDASAIMEQELDIRV